MGIQFTKLLMITRKLNYHTQALAHESILRIHIASITPSTPSPANTTPDITPPVGDAPFPGLYVAAAVVPFAVVFPTAAVVCAVAAVTVVVTVFAAVAAPCALLTSATSPAIPVNPCASVVVPL